MGLTGLIKCKSKTGKELHCIMTICGSLPLCALVYILRYRSVFCGTPPQKRGACYYAVCITQSSVLRSSEPKMAINYPFFKNSSHAIFVCKTAIKLGIIVLSYKMIILHKTFLKHFAHGQDIEAFQNVEKNQD